MVGEAVHQGEDWVPPTHLSISPGQRRRFFRRWFQRGENLRANVSERFSGAWDKRRGQHVCNLCGATIPAMPFSPSDLPWWGWLVCSVVALAVTYASWIIFDRCHDDPNSATGAFGYIALIFVAIPAGLIGFLVGLMGIVLFVKWVWTS